MKQIFFTIILLSSLKADEKSELIIDIEKSLMATCCWSGTVYDHGNKAMEIQIAGMVDQGKTKLEIINFFTDKYGERVLSVPVAEGFNIFAWLAPIIIAGLGVTIILLYMRTPKGATDTPVNSNNDSIAHSKQIEQELKELD